MVRPFRLLIVFSLLGLIGCGHLRFELTGFTWGGDTEPVTRTQEEPLPISRGMLLDVRTGYGTIEIVAGPGAAGLVKAQLTVKGLDEEEAEDLIREHRLVVEPTADGCRVRVSNDSDEGWLRVGRRPTVSYSIRVPEGVQVRARSNSGKIVVEGPIADCDLQSGYGNVSVTRVDGDVEARTSSGKIEVVGVRGAQVEAHSGYGTVTLRDIDGDQIVAASQSGRLRLENVRGSRLKVRSSYGRLELDRVSGDLDASTSSGSIRLNDASDGNWLLHSGYGGIHAQNVIGKLEARSSSGNISVSDLEGALRATTGYGSVHGEGRFSSLEASSSSGSVTIDARPGSRVKDGWSLRSGYGNVSLTLPGNASCDISAETGYGRIRCELERAFFQKKSRRRLEATLGDGGPAVKLKASSGNVTIISGQSQEHPAF